MLHIRLKEELDRLSLKPAAAAKAAGDADSQGLRDVIGGRKRLSADLLSALAVTGVDVLYVLTGQRGPTVLVAEEQVLLDGYRALDKGTKMRTLAFVLTETGPTYIRDEIKKKVAEEESKQKSQAGVSTKRTIKGNKNSMIEGDNNSLGNK